MIFRYITIDSNFISTFLTNSEYDCCGVVFENKMILETEWSSFLSLCVKKRNYFRGGNLNK